MPAKDQLDPNSLRSRARIWLAIHPGWHTPKQIAAGLNVTEQKDRTALTMELSRLARAQDGVTLHRPHDAPARGPGTKYARAGTTPPA